MIIDGVEVLYTMRNGKIVDPNIPMNGLVCYLDTRGKNNTDIYRNTLLDLSGNGNHRTLQNFSFTDGSGYENGGLKFDGVDDKVTPIPFNTTTTDSYTTYIDFTYNGKSPNTVYYPPILWATSDVHILTIHSSTHELTYYVANIDGTSGYIQTVNKILPGTRHKILVIRDGLLFKIYLDGIEIVNKTMSSTTRRSNGYLHVLSNTSFKELNPSKLYKVAVWNRALTDTEIQQLMEVE